MKKRALCISGILSFLAFLILLLISRKLGHSLQDQMAADRWSEKKDAAQVSCFFAADQEITVDSIRAFEYSLNQALQEASITVESQNPGARLVVDAYSADGSITLTNGNSSVTADAVGVGGDFFYFHPMELLSGSYFSENDLNHDYVIIDEDTAWQLFGSNDVNGMLVYIEDIPHIVSGVVRRPQGRLEEAAGLDGTLVFVSYETLDQLGVNNGINHYEIVMPNPVSNFAKTMVQERIGVDEKYLEVLENSSRFSLLQELKVLAAFGTRSMNQKAIIYPYWENIARGYEDIIALLLLFMVLLLVYPIVLIVLLIISYWKHKKWTVKSVWNHLKDRWERFLERKREERKRKKEEQPEEQPEEQLEEQSEEQPEEQPEEQSEEQQSDEESDDGMAKEE